MILRAFLKRGIRGKCYNKCGDGSWRTTGLQDEDKLRRDFWNIINNRHKVSANLLVDRDIETYKMNHDT